jgi:type IV secretory pathway TraG/TraD family ATPase VirD4
VLLDEAANIAPLRDLPAHLSQAAAHGVRIATVWQSYGQIRHRYGTAADGILANSDAKLFLGPIADGETRELLADLASEDQSGHPDARAIKAAQLRQLGRGRALVMHGSFPPAVVRTPRPR